jgi:hypothetical protein
MSRGSYLIKEVKGWHTRVSYECLYSDGPSMYAIVELEKGEELDHLDVELRTLIWCHDHGRLEPDRGMRIINMAINDSPIHRLKEMRDDLSA